jgi:hypothetical protein
MLCCKWEGACQHRQKPETSPLARGALLHCPYDAHQLQPTLAIHPCCSVDFVSCSVNCTCSCPTCEQLPCLPCTCSPQTVMRSSAAVKLWPVHVLSTIHTRLHAEACWLMALTREQRDAQTSGSVRPGACTRVTKAQYFICKRRVHCTASRCR